MRRNVLEQLSRETESQSAFPHDSFIRPPRISFFGKSKNIIPITADEPIVIVSGCHPATEQVLIQTREIHQDDTLFNSLSYIMKATLLELPEVKSVYFNFDEDQMAVDVWSILPDPQDEHRRAVYQKELELIEAFPALFFSFRTSGVSAETSPASSDYHHLTK